MADSSVSCSMIDSSIWPYCTGFNLEMCSANWMDHSDWSILRITFYPKMKSILSGSYQYLILDRRRRFLQTLHTLKLFILYRKIPKSMQLILISPDGPVVGGEKFSFRILHNGSMDIYHHRLLKYTTIKRNIEYWRKTINMNIEAQYNVWMECVPVCWRRMQSNLFAFSNSQTWMEWKVMNVLIRMIVYSPNVYPKTWVCLVKLGGDRQT